MDGQNTNHSNTKKPQQGFLTLNKRAFLLQRTGYRQNRQLLSGQQIFLMNQGAHQSRFLWSAPLSIMDSAWREGPVLLFAMHRKVDVAYGTAKKRAQIIESDAEFVIINYDGCGNRIRSYRQRWVLIWSSWTKQLTIKMHRLTAGKTLNSPARPRQVVMDDDWHPRRTESHWTHTVWLNLLTRKRCHASLALSVTRP